MKMKPCTRESPSYVVRQKGEKMNVKLALLAAMLLVAEQAMAEDVRVDCLTEQRIVCRDDETTCRSPDKEPATYHFTFDLTKKTGALVVCKYGCMVPSPLTVVHDNCAFVRDHGADCLAVNISVWEPIQQQTYTISNSRYVMTLSGIESSQSLSVTEFGRCAIR
jgi:hypothetical protein